MTNQSFPLIKSPPYNMDDFIIISDGSDSENAFPRASSENDVFKFRKKRKKTGSNNWLRSPPNTSTPMRTNVGIIDLTHIDSWMGELSESVSDIIDLTSTEDNGKTFPEISSNQGCFFIAEKIKLESQFNGYVKNTEGACWSCPTLLDKVNEDSAYQDKTAEISRTMMGMGSLEDARNCVLDQLALPKIRDDSLTCKINRDMVLESPLVLSNSHWQTASHNKISSLDYNNDNLDMSLKSVPTSSPSSIMDTKGNANKPESIFETASSKKTWLFKLRHFRNHPVNHLFFSRLKPEDREKKPLIKPLPIPSRRMNIVSHTVEEDFPRGTLHYLTEFVSPHHYPPTAHQYPSLDPPILCHIIRSILLGAQEPGIMNEAYTFLMKVQELHPVKLSTVPWDWNLFTEMMEKEKHPARLLFLQYVVQTLDDDFQLHVQRRSLQKCLAKSMLSCDKSFANIRDIVKWLVDSLKNVTEVCTAEYDHNTTIDHQKVTCLLQRMLSIAVEVDNSPTCSSNKIAGFMFTYVLSINSRHQREMFLKSIESTLLRAKLLDVMFQHSCELPPTLPLSLSKILYFIDHSTLLLEERSPGKEWQRWDEMLHHLCLLFFSYQRIMPEHLRTPVTERIDCILQSTQAHMPNEDLDITEADVEFCLNNFKTRTIGSEIPQTIQAKLNLLYSLFCTTIKHT